jgi:hypothetical protein
MNQLTQLIPQHLPPLQLRFVLMVHQLLHLLQQQLSLLAEAG